MKQPRLLLKMVVECFPMSLQVKRRSMRNTGVWCRKSLLDITFAG